MKKLLNDVDSALSVSFSGHRPDRLPGKGDPNTPEAQKLVAALRERIESAIGRGKVYFLHGAMAGFDIFAAEQVIALKEQYPQIQLVTVAPYRTHFYTKEKCWTPDWVKRAKAVFELTDIGLSLENEYRSGIYYKRNDVLIEYSSELICYWDGGNGGTKYTHDKAESKGLTISNLYALK